MRKFYSFITLIACFSTLPLAAKSSQAASGNDFGLMGELRGKTGLLRGVLKKVDPIHDQLFLHTFGGGDIRIAFDTRTELFVNDKPSRLSGIPAGSVVAIDTVMESGKLFARTVRSGNLGSAEINGQVVRYDPTRSLLTLSDPMSPEEVALHVSPETKLVNAEQAAIPQALVAGALVRVSFSAGNNVANTIEILATPGNTFTFEGKIVALDLRTRVLSLMNNTDQSLRDVAVNQIDDATLRQLHEGVPVNILAVFDGRAYNAQTVKLLTTVP